MCQASEPSEIVVYGTEWCPDCTRSCRVLREHQIPYRRVDIDKDPAGLAFVKKVNRGMRSVPTIVFPDGDVLVEPSDEQLAEKLS
jgi:glutaredoxin-like protein